MCFWLSFMFLCKVCLIMVNKLVCLSVFKIYIWVWDNIVLLSVNDGFLVVVLIKIKVLFLICGKNVFCWDLLKWCILFINNKVCCFCLVRFVFVLFIVLWIFFMFVVIVDIWIRFVLVWLVIICVKVVLLMLGGFYKIRLWYCLVRIVW